MNVLSLFSGIGGIELGLERAGFTTVGQVECDPYCIRVLEKHWPGVPKHDDVRTAAEWWHSGERPAVDIVCGGFPCQDISNAGKREGITGERSGLWFAMADVVRALRPRYVVMENVSAIVNRGLDVVCGTLAEIGYDLEWDCIPASSLGAPHRRDRWWGIAHPQRDELRQQSGRGSGAGGAGTSQPGLDGSPRSLAHPESLGRQSRTGSEWITAARVGTSRRNEPSGRIKELGEHWTAEPDVGRVAHGIPARVDRLRGLGNAVVPQVAEHVGRLLMGFAHEVV